MNPFAAMAAAASLESDEELRRRVMYVGGDGPALEQRIYRAEGIRLDEIAAAFGLERQKVIR
jgi:hypothetical protein